MTLQRHLFPLPTSQRVKVTPDQLALLDLIALRDGLPVGELANGVRVTLRNLLRKELISCEALGPAIYLVTPVGRMVRGRQR